MSARSSVRRQYSAVVARSGLAAWQRARRRRSAVIVTYHDISQQVFALHLAFLTTAYRVISLADMVAGLAGQAILPDNALAITFDDGYRSFYRNVYPLLLERRVPATVFLTTGFIGSEDTLWFNWLDLALAAGADLAPILPPELQGVDRRRLRRPLMRHLKAAKDEERLALIAAIRRCTAASNEQVEPYRMLRWHEVQTMSASGLVSFGGHTRTHPILTHISHEQAAAEIAGCAADLRRQLGDGAVHFAYPNGKADDVDDAIVRLLGDAGFSSAVMTVRGLCRPGDDPYRLRRITIDPRYTVDEVATNMAMLAPHLERGGE